MVLISLHLTEQALIAHLFCAKDCVSTVRDIKMSKTEWLHSEEENFPLKQMETSAID